MFPNQSSPTPSSATLKLRAAGEIIGALMNREDARKFGLKARALAQDFAPITGQHGYTALDTVYAIAGNIADDLLPRGASLDDVEAVADGFASMELTCDARADLLMFGASVEVAISRKPGRRPTR
jgi:hypothetical protein